jgi:hypothetical protein
MSLSHLASVLVFALAASPGGAVDYGGPGWYRVELADRRTLTMKILSEEEDVFLGSFQGTSLSLSKAELRSLRSLESLWKETKDTRDGLPPEVEARVREAFEQLATHDKEDALEAFKILETEFPASRSLVHEALRHRNARVRKLSVKLLGERGEAEKDTAKLEPILRDSEPTVRLAAVMAIRALGREGMHGKKSLQEYLRFEPVANNRKAAVKTFERWKDRDSSDFLIGLLVDERDSGVRYFIRNALKYLTKVDFGDNTAAWLQFRELRPAVAGEDGGLVPPSRSDAPRVPRAGDGGKEERKN